MQYNRKKMAVSELPIYDSLWVFALLTLTWVLSLCSSFLSPLSGALFGKVYQGFINIKEKITIMVMKNHSKSNL
jgi:hypothetical protein